MVCLLGLCSVTNPVKCDNVLIFTFFYLDGQEECQRLDFLINLCCSRIKIMY